MTAAVLLILYLYQIVPKEKRDLVHQRNRAGKISEESPISRPPLFPLMCFHPASHYSAILQKALPIVIMFIILALILFHQKRLTPGNEKMTFERYVMLKYDPLAVFRASRTPAGIYASSRWLGQGHDRSGRLISIEGLRRSTRDSSGTAAGQPPLPTASRHFELHLTLREPDESVNRGIDWLTDLTASLSDQEISRLNGKEIGLVSLQDMPFVRSSVPALLKAMLPFLR